MHLFIVKMCQNNDKGVAKKKGTLFATTNIRKHAAALHSDSGCVPQTHTHTLPHSSHSRHSCGKCFNAWGKN